jgi:DUF1365 family protein
MRRSALYVGSVRHRRFGEPSHGFEYPVWYLLIELDELPELAAETTGLSYNRFNLFAFDDRDHMGPNAEPVRTKLERWLRSRGIEKLPASVQLLTQVRILGSVFNPVSFYFCRDGEDVLQYVVAEVNNTFGETFCYLLSSDGKVVRDEQAKTFHVSPFQPVDGRYRFRIAAPGERISAHIDVLREGDRVFDTTLTAKRRPLSASSLLRTFARYPHLGLWTLALIHYQALRLWIKRAPFFSKPEPPVGAWRSRNG